MSAETDINLFLTGEIPRSKLFETLRQLERENAELRKLVEQMKFSINEHCDTCANLPDFNADDKCPKCPLAATLEAAEGGE